MGAREESEVGGGAGSGAWQRGHRRRIGQRFTAGGGGRGGCVEIRVCGLLWGRRRQSSLGYRGGSGATDGSTVGGGTTGWRGHRLNHEWPARGLGKVLEEEEDRWSGPGTSTASRS
jgi:hypothetical protein